MTIYRSRISAVKGIILAVVVATRALACTCGGDERPPEAGRAIDSPPEEGSAAEDLGALGARVRKLIQEERYDEAIDAAERSPSPELDQLAQKALDERRARELLLEACLETDGTDLAAVHETCAEIGETSRYRSKGCCSGADERFGEDRLRAVLDQAETEGFGPATKSATALATDLTMPEHIRDQAKLLAGDLTGVSDPEAAGEGGTARRSELGARRGSKQAGGLDDELSTAQESFAASAIRQARTALDRGDTAGCIGSLRGAPQSAGVVSLLISCHARAGDLGSACRLARSNPEIEYAEQFRTKRCR